MPYRYIGYLCLVMLCLLLPARQACAMDQRLLLHDFVLDNADGRLLVRFGIGVVDIEQLRTMLNNGESLRLHCTAALKDASSFWYDTTLGEGTLHIDLTHDQLTREYTSRISGQNAPYRSKGLQSLLTEAWGTLEIPLGPMSSLRRDTDYSVALTVSLEKTDIPPWLTKTLFFWSWKAAPSMRYSMKFTF